MRRLLALTLILLLAVPAVAADYGKSLSDADVIAISTLLAKPDDFVGKTVKVEGRITGVCAHRGCWMEIAGDEDFKSLRFKVDDGVIVIPADAVGSTAVAEGVFTRIELTPEQTDAQHKAQCQKDGGSCEHAAAAEGGVVYQLAGLGAVISGD